MPGRSRITPLPEIIYPGQQPHFPQPIADPVMPPGGNVPIGSEEALRAERERLEKQAPQITSFTWVQKTSGLGSGTFLVNFDCAFRDEPVYSYGALFLSARGHVPLAMVAVKRWMTGAGDAYIGAEMAVTVFAPPGTGGTPGPPAITPLPEVIFNALSPEERARVEMVRGETYPSDTGGDDGGVVTPGGSVAGGGDFAHHCTFTGMATIPESPATDTRTRTVPVPFDPKTATPRVLPYFGPSDKYLDHDAVTDAERAQWQYLRDAP